MDRNYRIHTNIASDTVLNVNMTQDYDFLEVLSLKLRQKDAYKLHSSNYGVIIGRVLANDAFGIPNAKISVFVPRDDDDASYLEAIYPYREPTTRDKDGRRYNLLPDYSDDECYRIVGTFPNKRLMLDDDTYLEVYDKYWKYSTVTNNAGDYMIFGIPTGSQQLHVDLDLSDIGILSQKPRDFEYKGYNITMFDNPNQFKESTNLESLAQIFSQDKSVFVYPFWGDDDNGVAAITRADVQIQYKFEPTCVFMGSIVSDNEGNSIGHKCSPEVNNGMNNQLIAGEGTIEMIRKTSDGLVEEFQIQGNQLINENGVWCYQIPMNLDFVGTDEYGNIIPTDNPNKGIPTRTQVRFRISKNETGDEGFSRHTAKYLVPMNPSFDEKHVVPWTKENGLDIEKMYTFGSSTPDSCFRDLYWNNVYSVKNYIPKVQVAHRPYSKNYCALKGSNLVDDQNPIPFNKLRVDIPFMYMIVCILFKVVMWIVAIVNTIICMVDKIFSIFNKIHNIHIFRFYPFKWVPSIPYIGCISLGGGLSEDNTAFYPGCDCKEGLKAAKCPDDMEGNCKKRASKGELMDRVQQRLAEDYQIIKLDLYQDWINGCLYMPLWHWRKRKKKTFLFFTLAKAKNEYCSCDKQYNRLKTYTTCNVVYSNDSLEVNDGSVPERENNWHRSKLRAQQVRYKNGIIKEVENNDGLSVYYYTALQATTENTNQNLSMDKRKTSFKAVRLYATDIILLGSLNETNLYGIPQFFKALPSTTANIPPIATIEETDEDDVNVKNYSENEIGGGEDSGTSITTGMDWGRNGEKSSPQYKNGLFMDLSCTYARTKAKSCFNVERLSELGVNLDMTYNMSYAHDSNGVETGLIDSDGFITKYELDDMENRAMFATMNHIGFIPQTYQDSISGYTTQVEDMNTNYLIPKFKYIYPVDFDGRMQKLMDRYKNGFAQSQYDDTDESYLTFRLGAESSSNDKTYEYGRRRHFYYNRGNTYEMPLYNNSFYFYFGIKKGSTAIDKFNEMFYSECYQNSKKPFTLNIEKLGRSYCPSIYSDNKGYAYIRATSDDIKTPFSYVLYDAYGVEVASESNMYDTDFVIGGTLTSEGEIVHNVNELTNQTYTLIVRDSNGRTISERIKLDMDKVSFEYTAQKLGTKFYNIDESRIDYICNKDNKFYGILTVNNFYIDSYGYEITNASLGTSDDNKYIVNVSGTPIDGEGAIGDASVVFEIYLLGQDSETTSIKNCMCDVSNSVPHHENIDVNLFTFDVEKHNFMFYVYQPSSFIVKITQMCGNMMLAENSSTEIIKILNGKNFNAYLNTMPVRFMIGTTNDSVGAEIGNNSHFYSSTANTISDDSIGKGLEGWFGTHQETSYRFDLDTNKTVPRNKDIWSDYVTVGSDITNLSTRKSILLYKFEKMFNVSNTAYLTESNNNTFMYTAAGGVEPILYRSVAPYYSNYNIMLTSYVYSDANSVSSVIEFPQVVGSNYHSGGREYWKCLDGITGTPRMNDAYTSTDSSNMQKLGNYFAAFTNNGRYITATNGDCKINIMSLPNYSAVNLETAWKRIGQDKKINKISDISKVYNSDNTGDGECVGKRTQPYLRTLFVDRRLDYDFIFFGPTSGSEFRLHAIENGNSTDKERVWKSARISGVTYGGIEMSYDEEYNIVSAETKYSKVYYVPSLGEEPKFENIDDAKAYAKEFYPSLSDTEIDMLIETDYTENEVSANTRLEYTYSITTNENDNAFTKYNVPTNCIWVNREDTSAKKLYNKGYSDSNDGTSQYIKTLYSSDINNYDVRQLYWSNFNRYRLNEYGNRYQIYGNTGILNNDLDFYVYNHYADTDLYNSDFNMDSISGSPSANYPSRRLIDIGNLGQAQEYFISMTSCSYGMNPEINDDGQIKSYVEGGETVEISLEFTNPIQFLPPNAESKDYGNAIFKKASALVSGFTRFEANVVNVSFRMVNVSSDNFDIFTQAPYIIKVLSSTEFNDSTGSTYHTDGISYIKTTSEHDGIFNNTEGNVETRISNATIHRFETLGLSKWAQRFSGYQNDIFAPNGVKLDVIDNIKLYFYRKDNDKKEYLLSDENDFYNIQFSKENLPLIYGNGEKVYVFAILIRRLYKGNDYDQLTRRIETFETSSLFDVRPLLLKVLGGYDNTYIERKVGSISVDVEGTSSTEIPSPTGQGEVYDGTVSASGSGETQSVYQSITFQMLFLNDLEPHLMMNQAFADFDSMGFTFKFTNGNKESFYLTPEVSYDENISTSAETYVNFKIIFTQEMGVLADKEWSDGASIEIYAKTQDNFIYKVADGNKPFMLTKASNPSYNPNTRQLSVNKEETQVIIKN